MKLTAFQHLFNSRGIKILNHALNTRNQAQTNTEVTISRSVCETFYTQVMYITLQNTVFTFVSLIHNEWLHLLCRKSKNIKICYSI